MSLFDTIFIGIIALLFAYYIKPNGLYWGFLSAFLDERDKKIINKFQNNQDHKKKQW